MGKITQTVIEKNQKSLGFNALTKVSCDRSLRSTDYSSCFIFWSYEIRISKRKLNAFIEVFRDFTQLK